MKESYNQILEMRRMMLEKCLETWGEDAQINVVIEEMAELTKELCKWNRGSNNAKQIIEETVDVLIMINQLTIIFSKSSEEFEEVLKFKLERVRQRLLNDLQKKELEVENE